MQHSLQLTWENFFQDGCGAFHPVGGLVVHFVSGERGGGESEHYESQYELFHGCLLPEAEFFLET